jgi:hypothetical protein
MLGATLGIALRDTLGVALELGSRWVQQWERGWAQ